jgi:hypothetical protein
VLAVLTKTVVDTGPGGIVHLLASGETYALIVVGLGGTYLQQLAFQAGALHTSLLIMTVLEPMIAAILGLTRASRAAADRRRANDRVDDCSLHHGSGHRRVGAGARHRVHPQAAVGLHAAGQRAAKGRVSTELGVRG